MFSPFDRSGIRLHIADLSTEATQERRFTGTVGTDDSDLFARLDHDTEIPENRLVIRLGQFFRFNSKPMQFFAGLEPDKWVDTAGRLDVFHLDLLNLAGTGSRLFGFRFVGRKPADKFLQLGNPFLRLGVRRLLLRLGLSGRQHVIIIGSRIDLQRPIVHIGNMGTYLIQKMTIMRNDDHGGIAFVQHIFQPANRIDVEVIGRFVQQQNIRIGKQGLCEQDPQLPARCNGTHQAFMQFQSDTDAEEQFACPCFRRIAVVFGKSGFELGRLHVIFIGRIGIGINGIAFRHGFPHLLVPHHDDIENAHILIRELILIQFAKTFILVESDSPGSSFPVTTQNFDERRLAGTVSPDQAVTVSFTEFDGNIFEQGLGAELYGNIGG